MATSIATRVPNTSIVALGDRVHDAALDHGAVSGAYTRLAARASVNGMKRCNAVAVNYPIGFVRGFKAGWKSAAV